MKLKNIILLLASILPLLSLGADTALAPLPKMTQSEADDTVLAEGVIVRVVNGDLGEIRVGDGVTAGGIRIGDGIGWEEGDTLTQDLNLGEHRLNVGGWSLQLIGGWGAISGSGEIDENSGILSFSVAGSIIAQLYADEALLEITRFEYVHPVFELDTVSGATQPTIQYTTNLVSGIWLEAPVDSVVTNAGTLTHTINPTNFDAVAYFRATIPTGSGSGMNVIGTLKESGESVATDAELSAAVSTKAEQDGSDADADAFLSAIAFGQQSAGRIYGGAVTQGTGGAVNIAAGAGLIKTGSGGPGCCDVIPTNLTGQASDVQVVQWNAVSELPVAGVGYNLIYWDASATNFAVSLKEDFYSSFDFVQDFTVGRVYWDGTEMTIRLCGMNAWNFNRRVQMFGEERFPVERASGLVISSSGLQYTVTDGVIWAELVNRFDVDGKELADNFRLWYTDDAAKTNWTYATTNTINNSDYNGTGLTALTVNRWRCDYVYTVHDGTHHVVMGDAQYTSAAAAQNAARRTPPGLLGAYASLIGRITVQQGASSVTADSASATTFSAAAVPDHASLAGLQGGAAGEYYHLTAAQLASVTNGGGGGISGTNAVLSGTLTLTNATSTAWSVGYWTNSVTGVGTNGVYVRMVYTPAGTTNTYYSLYQ